MPGMKSHVSSDQSSARFGSDQITLPIEFQNFLVVQWEGFDLFTGEARYTAMRVTTAESQESTRWKSLTETEACELQRNFMSDMRRVAALSAKLVCDDVIRENYGSKNPKQAWLDEQRREATARARKATA
jgi:hypothetical protein